MFKTRNKKDTSGRNMVRDEKRERILGIAITSGHLYIQKDTGKTELFIVGSRAFSDMLQWKIDLIKETGWLSTPEIYESGEASLTARYNHNNKLRIYRKWLYRHDKKTLTQVLKYMYSPLFASLLLIDLGQQTKDSIVINMTMFKQEDIQLLQRWFKDLFDINCFEGMYNGMEALVFEHQDRRS